MEEIVACFDSPGMLFNSIVLHPFKGNFPTNSSTLSYFFTTFRAYCLYTNNSCMTEKKGGVEYILTPFLVPPPLHLKKAFYSVLYNTQLSKATGLISILRSCPSSLFLLSLLDFTLLELTQPYIPIKWFQNL